MPPIVCGFAGMDETMEAALAQSTSVDPKTLIASPEVRRLVEGLVRRRVPAMEVEDVVQTVLCDALASDSLPEDEEQLRRWIVGITRHKVADFHRKGGKAKQVELPETMEGEEAPLSAREWARWAEKQTEGNAEAKRTLDWMAREGGGEKLAHIAAEEKLPATQVRQRVSRLRRFMKQRWRAELAAVAAVVILALIAWRWLRDDEPVAVPEPVPERTPEPKVQEAERMRAEAFEHCASDEWQPCLDDLDAAKALDPEGDEAAEVQRARERAAGALEEQRKQEQSDREQSKGKLDVDGLKTATPKSVPPAPTTKLPSKRPTKPAPSPKELLQQKSLPTKPAPQKPSPKKASPTKSSGLEGTFDSGNAEPPSQQAPPPSDFGGLKTQKK